MELEEIREQCLLKPFVTEDFPFDQDTLVFKVKGKMFALTNLEAYPSRINLKCEPELAIDYRERYPGVQPGFHMNKKHWNTITLDGSVPAQVVLTMLDMSYDLVVKKLKRAERDEILLWRAQTQE